jgi:hypothetical protein
MKLDSTGFKTLVGFLIALTTLVGTAFTVDNRYAKDEQVKQVEQQVQKVEKRLDKKILKDRANALQERIWKLEDRYNGKKIPAAVKEELRKNKAELVQIRKDLEK